MSDAKPPSTGLARFRARLTGHETQTPISPEAAAIHARVDQLSELELRDVMTPRVDVAFLTLPVTPEAIAEAVRDTGHSCFPVVSDDDLDDVLGVIYVNDLFRSSTLKRAIGVSLPTAEEITRKIRRPFMLPETFDLLESLSEMRKQHRTFALVLDEHGGVAGVVSIRDILEQLVGDLNDEFDEDDEPPSCASARAAGWSTVKRTSTGSKKRLALSPEGEYVTIAGFVLDLAGEIPVAGTTYTYGEWTFRVQSVEKRRISELVIEHHPPVEPEVPSDHLGSS